MSLQQLRDNVLYASGYLKGQPFSLSGATSRLYGIMISKLTSLIALPLPLLSFLALPFFGGSTTSINFILFYLTWSTLVWTHDPLKIELYGTLTIRLLAFLLPAFVSLGADLFVPSLAASAKARGRKQLPGRIAPPKLARVAAWATFNILLTVAIQSSIEIVLTKVLNARSLLQVSTVVPLPWTILKHLSVGYVLRGLMHYYTHRYVLHAPARSSPIAKWHRDWAHSLNFTFPFSAAYDHPACHLLAHWLPLYLPAVYLRMHVLTWLLFLTITSLESVFIYSGYAVLPSAIVLPGMARRIDAHYTTRGSGNYGHLGLMDWLCGTSCATGEADFGEDMNDEVEKRDMRRRVSGAVDDAAGLLGDARKRFGRSHKQRDHASEDDVAIDEESAQSQDEPRSNRHPLVIPEEGRKRSKRAKARKD